MNYLVYLGLRNYDDPTVRRELAQKSHELFLKEWREQRHVHENYNAMIGTGDDVSSSERFYHWGALLGSVENFEQTEASGRAGCMFHGKTSSEISAFRTLKLIPRCNTE